MKQMMTCLIFVVLFVSSCEWAENRLNPTWMGTYYPNGNLSNGKSEFGFQSLEQCRAWALSMRKNEYTSFDYECGKNCKSDGYVGYICDETLR